MGSEEEEADLAWEYLPNPLFASRPTLCLACNMRSGAHLQQKCEPGVPVGNVRSPALLPLGIYKLHNDPSKRGQGAVDETRFFEMVPSCP